MTEGTGVFVERQPWWVNAIIAALAGLVFLVVIGWCFYPP